MALTLSKTNITTGQTIQASQITQSVDALTGTTVYDITISGSLTLTGSVNSLNGYTGSLLGTSSFAVSSSRAVTASFAISSSRAVTASFAWNATSPFPFSGDSVITGSLTVTSDLSVSQSFIVGNEGDPNKDFKLDSSGITVPSSSFTPRDITSPDNWLVIQYTAENSVRKTGYIPIYYTTV